MSTPTAVPSSFAQAFRDLSRAIQGTLDHLAGRFAHRRLLGAPLAALARGWTTGWWIAVTAVAGATAWTAALLLDLASPVPAAVGAVLTVGLSLNRSLRTGASLIVATAAALLVAFALYRFWGLHVWTVAVLVAVALIIGRMLRLGPEGSLQVPATALFVYILGDQLTDDVILHRILATLLGVAIGVGFSYIAHPERPEERIGDRLADAGRRLGDLLVAMGSLGTGECTRRRAAEWLTESRELSIEVRRIGEALDELALGKRFSIGIERNRGRALRDQCEVLQRTAFYVGDIARGLFDATGRGAVRMPDGIGRMLTSTGAAVGVHADALPGLLDSDGTPPTGVLRALEQVDVDRSHSVASIKELDDTGALLLGGALVTEMDRVVGELSRS